MKKVQGPTVRKTLTVATSRTRWQPIIVLVAVIVVMSIVVLSGQELKHVPPAAPTFTVLHTFAGADGEHSVAGLVQDAAGNLYGTTYGGGSACDGGTCGVVFKLSPTGTETVLHSFTGGADGGGPEAGLVRDAAGNLYGTTNSGGSSACTPYGCGTVFKLSPTGTLTGLHSFTGGADGRNPVAGLVRDAAGNLYGTTTVGGLSLTGGGTVFKLSPTGTFTVLHSFTFGADGRYPYAGLLRDAAGNLYGTTAVGGLSLTGGGTVFKLSPTGTFTVLYSFTGGADGGSPVAGLIQDGAGNFYGTTLSGGSGRSTGCAGPGVGCGVVFELIRCDTAASGYDFKVLYNFTGGTDGGTPYAGLLRDAAGNLYGTTQRGGAESTPCINFGTCGVVFKLSPTGIETVLHSFTRGADGALPYAGLIQDAAGNLYGTTYEGGAACALDMSFGCGVVFRLAP